jgi:rare lipoprotein A
MPMTSADTRARRTPRSRRAAALVAAWALVLAPGALVHADTQSTSGMASAIGRGLADLVQEGVISWYGAAFHDRKTASGEPFDSGALTMAHPSLPFGTRVKVTNLRNGRSVVVRVNDRGPFVGTRIADLSQAAATEIGMMRRGVARARIEVLQDIAVPETY